MEARGEALEADGLDALEAYLFCEEGGDARPLRFEAKSLSRSTWRFVGSAIALAALASGGALYWVGRLGGSAQENENASDALGLDSESQLRSKLNNIGAQDEDAESRLEAGAAAMASHWFGGGEEDDASHPAKPGTLAGALKIAGHGWYRVNIDSIVRKGESLDSPQVGVAHAGLFVHAAEHRGRRVRVDHASTDLESSRQVSGWMSESTAGGHLKILRPSRQAALLRSQKSPEEIDTMRVRYEQDAARVAEVTAWQKQLNDKLHKIDPNSVAKGLTHFGRHRAEYERKGAEQAQKTGEHVGKSITKGANQLLGALDDLSGKIAGEVPGAEASKVQDLKIPVPDKKVTQAIAHQLDNAFKHGFK